MFKKKNIPQIAVEEVVKESGLHHIAFIMDGNGRWATEKHLPREAGHSAGSKNFKTVVRYCKSIGIEYVTVYAFSTENWKRPKKEVDAIMHLLDVYIDEAEEEDDVEFFFIGDIERIEERLRDKIKTLEDMTRGRKYRLNIALNYGGRAEIVHAVNEALKQGKTEINEEDIEKCLYTAGCPDPDLIVRTAGEYRISNFLLWQCAYSEFYFTDKYWPDLSKDDINTAVNNFSHRTRRFGAVVENKNVKDNK